MKRIAQTAAVILATLTVVVVLWRLRDAVILFVFSLVIAAAARSSVNYLVERHWPRGLAMAATYLVSLGVILGLLLIAGGALMGELQQASDSFAKAYEQFKASPPDGNGLHLLASRLPRINELYAAISSAQGTALVGNAVGYTLGIFDLLTKVVIVLVLSIYWGADQAHFERLWLSLLPAEQRMRARNIWRAIEVGVGGYVRSELLQTVLAGVVLAIGYWAIGMPYPILLALLGAIAWLIPLLGGVLALIPVAIVGMLRGPLWVVVGCAFTLAVFLGLEFIVERRLVDRRGYSSILTILVMIAMGSALGVFGVLVGPPVAAAIQIFFRELMAQPIATVTEPARSESHVSQLRERLMAARKLAEQMDEPMPPELASLMDRLASLVEKVDDEVDELSANKPSNGFGRLFAWRQGEKVRAE